MIAKTAGVCGGAACVYPKRITVRALEAYRRSGASEADILFAYPSLLASDLQAAWDYVRVHKEEIDREIAENEVAE